MVVDGVRSNDLVGPPLPEQSTGVRISWGSDATGRGSNCPASAQCRNLGYDLAAVGSGPYTLECWADGRNTWSGTWSGREASGCYYRTANKRVHVVVNGAKSNELTR